MARINLTKKSVSEQLRIFNDYLIIRAQHKSQNDITIDQLLKRFRNNRCFTNKSKAIWLSKLLKAVQSIKKVTI